MGRTFLAFDAEVLHRCNPPATMLPHHCNIAMVRGYYALVRPCAGDRQATSAAQRLRVKDIPDNGSEQ
jgi:hypothetical protein